MTQTYRQFSFFWLSLALIFAAWQLPMKAADTDPVTLIKTIQLPNQGGFTDYLIADSKNHRLYVSAPSHNRLVVIDTRNNQVIADIPNLTDVRSIAIVPDLKLGFTSDRAEDQVGVIDLVHHQLLHKLPGGQGPNAILYDPAVKLVYVADKVGQKALFIDPYTQKTVAEIPLGGIAEYAQVDSQTGLVYQNLDNTNEVVVIDPVRKLVINRFSLGSGISPSGLAYDSKNHRLFVACGNEKLIVLDSTTGQVISELPIGAGVDFAAYDPGLHRIYTANGASGTMSVIQQEDANQYNVLANVPTHAAPEGSTDIHAHMAAHTLAVDPVTHRIYVAYGNKTDVYQAKY